MTMSTSGCNLQMGDGSVRGPVLPPRPVTAQALVQAMRQVGPRVEAHAYGTPGPRLRAVRTVLHRFGLALSMPIPKPGAGPQPLLMVVVHAAVAGGPSAAVLFLASEDTGPGSHPSPLMLPAVQKVREAACRATRGGALGLVLVQAPGTGPSAVPTDQMALNFARIDL